MRVPCYRGNKQVKFIFYLFLVSDPDIFKYILYVAKYFMLNSNKDCFQVVKWQNKKDISKEDINKFS